MASMGSIMCRCVGRGLGCFFCLLKEARLDRKWLGLNLLIVYILLDSIIRLIFDLCIDVDLGGIHNVFGRQWMVMGGVNLGISEVRWKLKDSCDFYGVNAMYDCPNQRGECFSHRFQNFE